MNEEFEKVKHDWESHDGWQFADRDAERKYFFQAGQRSEREACAEIADDCKHINASDVWEDACLSIYEAIRERGDDE